MVVIHDGVCGSPTSYVCAESRGLARILTDFPVRFGLLDVCECGCCIWAATVERHRVAEVLGAIGTELSECHGECGIEEAETDCEPHEVTIAVCELSPR